MPFVMVFYVMIMMVGPVFSQFPLFRLAGEMAGPDGRNGLTGLWGNPGMEKMDSRYQLGVFYHQPFLMAELSTRGAGIAYALPGGLLGASFVQQGFSLFRYDQLAVSCSQRLGPHLSGGLRLFAHHIIIGEGYGQAWKPGGEAGVVIKAARDMVIGGRYTFSPVKKPGTVDVVQSAGILEIAWDVSASCRLWTVCSKQSLLPPSYHAGLVVRKYHPWFIQGRCSLQPLSWGVDIGWRLPRLAVLLTNTYQPWLGHSPGIIYLQEGGSYGHTEKHH